MKRIAAAVAVAALLLGLTTAAEVSALAATSASVLSSADETDPVGKFGACLAAGGEGDFLLLIDESGSLQDTDPQLARVTAVQYLLRQLASFADTSTAVLNVKFAVFGHSYTSLSDWVAINSTTLGNLSPVADSLATHNEGMDTDYWTALEHGRRDLAERRSARGDESSCQAIAWFTDGQLDFDPRTSQSDRDKYGVSKEFAPDIALNDEAAAQQLTQIATDLICTSGGLADQIRSSGITTFVVGLDASGPDFSLVQSIATGTNQAGKKCGDLTDPVPGTFTPASDIDALLFAFDALGRPGQTPIQIEAGICQISACAEETHKFVLDSTTPTVHLLASAEVGGLQVSLTSPTGQAVSLEPKTVGAAATAMSGQTSVQYTWQSERTVSVDLSSANSESWAGLWQLSFVDPTGSSGDRRSFSNVRINSDYRPAILTPAHDEWHADDVFELGLGVTDLEGAPVDAATFDGTIELTAVLVDSRGGRKVVADGLTKETLGQPVKIDLTGIPLGESTVELKLVHTTAPATTNGGVVEPGTMLQPQTVDVAIPILPPLDFPSLTTSRLDFGVLDGTTAVPSEIVFAGSGCVWLDSGSVSIVAGPADAGVISVTTPTAMNESTCVSASKPLAIEFSSENLANGSVNGTIDVLLAPEGEPERAIPATVSFTADLRKPLNAATYTLGLILALVLGIGIPVALIYIAKVVVAVIPARALVSERIRIGVVDGRVLRDGNPFALKETDFRDITGIKPGGVRSLAVGGVSMSTRITASPSGSGYVVVDTPGFISASDSIPAWVSKVPRARLPLAVHNHWVVLRSPGAPAGDAEVLVMLSGDADSDRKISLVDDLVNRLPDVLEQLVAQGGDAPVDAGDAGGWDSSGGSPRAGGFDVDSASNNSSNGFNASNSGFGFSD